MREPPRETERGNAASDVGGALHSNLLTAGHSLVPFRPVALTHALHGIITVGGRLEAVGDGIG